MRTAPLSEKKPKFSFRPITCRLDVVFWVYCVLVIESIVLFLRVGDDIAFHLQRMDAIIREFNQYGFSAFPVRLYHHTVHGYGYASPLFYSDIFFWPFAVVAARLNLSVVTAYKIMLCTVFVVTGLMASFSFGKVFRGREKKIAVFLYMVSVNIFGNATGSWVGRDFAAMFVPLCFCAFYCLIYTEQKASSAVQLGIGVAGLLFSNVLDAAIVVFSLFVILLFCIRKITLDGWLYLGGAVAVCLIFSAWFLFPMVEQMASQTFLVTSEEITLKTNDLHLWVMPWIGLFFPPKIAEHLYRILGWEIYFQREYFYGMLFFIVLVVLLTVKRKAVFRKPESHFYIALLALLLLYMVFQTKFFPHAVFAKWLGTMQFPWRTAIVMTCFGCFFGARLLHTAQARRSTAALVILSAVLVGIYALGTYGYDLHFQTAPFGVYKFDSDTIQGSEYLPAELLPDENGNGWWAQLQERGDAVICSDPSVKFEFQKSFDHLTVQFERNNGTAVFELPRIYYKGYAATDPVSGEPYALSKSNRGLVTVSTGKESGVIDVYYRGTAIQKISARISLAGVLLLVLWIVGSKIRLKKAQA